MSSISFLGLGAMGSRMAARLLAAGHPVAVYNRSPGPLSALVEQGVRAARTPREAARGAELVIAMVRDDEASRALWTDPEHGALLGLEPGAMAIESSTLTPAWIAELGRRGCAVGVELLDAPVLGSRVQAEAGALISLVGGPSGAVEGARAVLEAYSGTIHHVGPLGAGARTKLAVNGLFAASIAALVEHLGVLERGGLTRAAAVELLAGLPVTSPAMKGILSLIAAGDFAPQFPIDLVAKDLEYLLADADRLDARVPITRAARSVYADAIARGLAADNIAGVAKLYFSATT